MNTGRSYPPPPSRANLKVWWKGFIAAQRAKHQMATRADTHTPTPVATVFGVPLRESLRYANVPISTANGKDSLLYIYGYVPVVVAKCGLYLKEVATEVEGTFRVNGSARRMRELQAEFETPPRYGKDINWKNTIYTSHDVASVLRRYLTQMPEPVVPHHLYHKLRDAYSRKPFNHGKVIKEFQELIRSMPRANQYLLLYVLDLLSVFARKSNKNLMTATNLAVIFRPSILSHPDQELSPEQHKLSQDIVEFLIEEQDLFLLDIPPPPRSDSILAPSPNAGGTGLGSPLEPDDAYFMVPSSGEDEERSRGGWKLVETKPLKEKRPSLTTHTNSSDIVLGTNGETSVKRSVTVPSRKSINAELATEPNKLRRKPRGARDPSPNTPSDPRRSSRSRNDFPPGAQA